MAVDKAVLNTTVILSTKPLKSDVSQGNLPAMAVVLSGMIRQSSSLGQDTTTWKVSRQ